MTAIGLGINAGTNRQLFAVATDDTKAKFLGKVLNYIPGDVVAGYVAVIALTDSSNDQWGPEWLTAAVFFVLAPIVVVAFFFSSFKKTHNAKPTKSDYPVYRIIVAPIAFTTWVFSLPSSPFQDFGEIADYARTLVLIAGAIGLGVLGMLFDPED
jgi:uncharacterized membrane protein SirB2